MDQDQLKSIKASAWAEVRLGRITPHTGSPRRLKPPTPQELELAGLDRVRQALMLRLIGEHPEIDPDFWWEIVLRLEDSPPGQQHLALSRYPEGL